MVVVFQQTIWIALFPGLAAISTGAISIVQRQWLLLWAAAGFVAFGWFFIRRDWLEIGKLSRQVTVYSLKPFGLKTTDFTFEDIRDFVFEYWFDSTSSLAFQERSTQFRPALVTSTGSFPLTAWFSHGSPRGYEPLRMRILVALEKLRPGLV
jgi:hypothetical protein